ncbi:hypothetical protein LINPERHAP2_LOCUS41245, partial [Linum perenne]
RYRDRKGDVSINVLGVCNPNTEFIYCSAGWEGSAHDGQVLRDALGRPNGFRVPGGNRPQTAEEYYNMKHSKARNCIERAFADIVNACCLLHNFIKREQGVDVFERLYASTEHANVTNPGVVEYVG